MGRASLSSWSDGYRARSIGEMLMCMQFAHDGLFRGKLNSIATYSPKSSEICDGEQFQIIEEYLAVTGE